MALLDEAEIDRLSPLERLALISQLCDSLEDHEVLLSEAQREELDRRLESLKTERNQGTTWVALKADLERRSP
jgi:putative addiction module component (TIGR02574 family)